jgi:hypothetical protein
MARRRPCIDCNEPLNAMVVDALRRFPGPALCDRCRAARVLCARCGELRRPQEMARPWCRSCRREYDADRYVRRAVSTRRGEHHESRRLR